MCVFIKKKNIYIYIYMHVKIFHKFLNLRSSPRIPQSMIGFLLLLLLLLLFTLSRFPQHIHCTVHTTVPSPKVEKKKKIKTPIYKNIFGIG